MHIARRVCYHHWFNNKNVMSYNLWLVICFALICERRDGGGMCASVSFSRDWRDGEISSYENSFHSHKLYSFACLLSNMHNNLTHCDMLNFHIFHGTLGMPTRK